RAGVHARQRVLAGALGRGVLAGFPQRRAPEQRLDGIQPPRALRMAGRGDVLAALGMHDQGRTMRGRVVTPSVIVRRRPRGPPLPGSTVITRTAVTTGRTHSISSRGVAGLRATAGSTPSARICWIVW